MCVCVCVWGCSGGGGATHVLIIGPGSAQLCSLVGSSASPLASVTVIKTSRPTVVCLH